MRLNQFRDFVAVTEAGGISAAARQVGFCEISSCDFSSQPTFEARSALVPCCAT